MKNAANAQVLPETRRKISLFGITGSVGDAALRVVRANPERFAVEVVTANHNGTRLAEIAREIGARHAVVASEDAYERLRAGLSGSAITTGAGRSALLEAASRPVDVLLAAIVGAVGLESTMAAIGNADCIALANKECLVCAGDLFMRRARAKATKILPVDSEHNAIFQLLNGHNLEDVTKIIITASGGPFLKWDKAQMINARLQDALAHPNWSMGAKISIDSATMMNKALELIEAHHLFALDHSMLEVVVHPQSIVHGLVSKRDGTMLAVMAMPDMGIPVGYCLNWPDCPSSGAGMLDLAGIGGLTFERPDRTKFPAIDLAEEVLKFKGGAPTVMNGANEVAVEAFIAGRIGFSDIVPITRQVLDLGYGCLDLAKPPSCLDDFWTLDNYARKLALDEVDALGD